MASRVSIALRCSVAILLVLAAYRCLVFARAAYLFKKDTATSIPAAHSLVPFNGAYSSRLAAWQPERKLALLNEAVSLNPFDVESWIQLGFTAELQQGNAIAAERYYLRAADVDKMFLPRWTLTNFYFRQQNQAEFFHWARATLEITPYQAQPVFAQMWLMTHDATFVGGFVPDRPSVLVQYALYLSDEKQFNAIPRVIQRLTHDVNPQSASSYGRDDLIGPIEDNILLTGSVAPALQIWQSLTDAHWLPYSAPTETAPLTNGDFRNPFFGHGFDWTIVNADGMYATQAPDEGAVRVTLSGDQPELVPLLRQFIPLAAGATYQLTWRAEGDGIVAPSGLKWHIYPVGKGTSEQQTSSEVKWSPPQRSQSLQAQGKRAQNSDRANLPPSAAHSDIRDPLSAASGGDTDSGDLQSGDLLSAAHSWNFQWGAGSQAAILALEYARPSGTTRAVGTIKLRSLSLKEASISHEKK